MKSSISIDWIKKAAVAAAEREKKTYGSCPHPSHPHSHGPDHRPIVEWCSVADDCTWTHLTCSCRNHLHTGISIRSYHSSLGHLLEEHKPQARAFIPVSHRDRTILALGYWTLGNICRYWVVLLLGDIFFIVTPNTILIRQQSAPSTW